MLPGFDMEASFRMHIEFFGALVSLKHLNEITDFGQECNYKKQTSCWDKTLAFIDTNGNCCSVNVKSDCLKPKQDSFPLLYLVSDKFWGEPDKDSVECDGVTNEKLYCQEFWVNLKLNRKWSPLKLYFQIFFLFWDGLHYVINCMFLLCFCTSQPYKYHSVIEICRDIHLRILACFISKVQTLILYK